MRKYLKKTKEAIGKFTEFEIVQVPRSKNKQADTLSKMASVTFSHLTKMVLVEILKHKSISEEEVCELKTREANWMTSIIQYLKDGVEST